MEGQFGQEIRGRGRVLHLFRNPAQRQSPAAEALMSDLSQEVPLPLSRKFLNTLSLFNRYFSCLLEIVLDEVSTELIRTF